MNYVESFNLFGVEAKQIPCITGIGKPTESTSCAVGCFYMDTKTGETYKCVDDLNGVYTWKKETCINDNAVGSDTWSSKKIVEKISEAIYQAGIIQATLE